MYLTSKDGAGLGAVLLASAILLTGCNEHSTAEPQLPSEYPTAQVPIIGKLENAETIAVGATVWRVTVEGKTTVAAAQALIDAGFAPMVPGVPLDAGVTGAMYRGRGYTVGLSANDGSVTYIVSPNPSP